ncbi:hypothetical protein TVAG_079410 [Trichomonas vaginalis G3]|uniref:Eukaryotic initiation factor 4E family protein n=1 Tax=Trichomonas vaginalis (strain ATCC PRA-98 / G3) TaxID=412133 RepID=A2EF73_TRIV3|nr:translation initiation factor protein [Trichomonas vaginalis G3]EAY08683.1 hypothetical protein TVAG_079410 [Trichomonas vaginalis G3]KAI5492810.1 translation initiation factor protein [Trichomonas vaginalis G3]|eukprot:XP_001320906.1 hypothetical protein [Trichomonas vaginalis G3]
MSKPRETLMTHNLHHKWRFWVVFCKFLDKQVYEIESIISVNSLELFVDYFNSLPNIDELHYNETNQVSLAFFADDIKPAWEDPHNAKGGSYHFVIQDSTIVHEIWKKLLVHAIIGDIDKILSENQDHKKNYELCGITVAVKKPGYMFAIWTKTPPNQNGPVYQKIQELVQNVVPKNVNFSLTTSAHGHKNKKKK